MKIQGTISKYLSVKIGLWLVTIFIMVSIFGWDILNDMKHLSIEASVVEKNNHKSHDLHDLEIHINHYINPVKEFLITGDYRLESSFNQRYQSLLIELFSYDKQYSEHELVDLPPYLHSIQVLSHKIFTLPFAVGNMEGPILLQEVDEKIVLAMKLLSEQHHRLDMQVNHAMHMMNGLRMDMRDEAMALLVILFIVLLLVTHFIYGQVVLPLLRMRKVVKKIGHGDFTQQCLVRSADEIGELALAFNAMGRALEERDRKLDHARSLAAYQEKMNALGLIAAGIAHEIGNPLSAISVSLQVAQKKIVAHDEVGIGKHIDAAFKETERIEAIIQVILNFARHETQQDVMLLDLRPIIDNAVYLAQMSPDKKSVHVSVKTVHTLSKAYADEGIVLQVLINLILNAIDACKNSGQVTVHAFESPQGMMINVQDTGCGIAPEVHVDIFKPHFTSKSRGKGTGLGLAISRELMHSIHGSLKLIASDSSGSCFQICLPIREDS